MLQIADHHPKVIERCLATAIELYKCGVFIPTISTLFSAADISSAHDYLEKRNSIGKVVVQW
jgi:NADPH:quinone reductase-like Zn-dependent oxidoreductase